MSMADDAAVLMFEGRLTRKAAAVRDAAPHDDPICRANPAAFNAAYDSMVAGGIVKVAQIRAEIARRILAQLVPLTHAHGAVYMTTVAESPVVRMPMIGLVWSGESASSAVAIDEAMAAAARVLAKGVTA